MTKIAAQPLGGAPRPAPGDSLRGTGPPKPPDVTERLLCWCCAQWGLTKRAICARTRLCTGCLSTTRERCKKRHMAQALAEAAGA